jgi:hypothetical protein
MFKEAVEAKPDFIVAKQNLSIALTDWGTHLKLADKVEEGTFMSILLITRAGIISRVFVYML